MLDEAASPPADVAGTALQLAAQLQAGDERLSAAEHALLREWLRRLSAV